MHYFLAGRFFWGGGGGTSLSGSNKKVKNKRYFRGAVSFRGALLSEFYSIVTFMSLSFVTAWSFDSICGINVVKAIVTSTR